ncbi:tripartite tricarboxylate transporter TctB family protein [Arthrobacter sp. TMS1-12-1]
MSSRALDIIGPEPPSLWTRISKSDLVITLVFLVIFGGAFLLATEWKILASAFPLGVSATGAVAALTFLVRVVFFPNRPDAPRLNVPKEAPGSTSDQEHAFFDSLTARDWKTAIFWLAGFYVALALLGIYVAVAAFTVGYLRYGAAKSWKFAVIYAMALAALIYVTFSIILHLPLPGGLFNLA